MAEENRRKYKFGNETFNSKGALFKYCAAVRKKYKVGQTISDPKDIAFLESLIAQHPHSTEKIGVGIARFYVDYARPPYERSTCFWLQRVDGEPTEFSAKDCVIEIGQLNKRSLREEIKPQLMGFRSLRLANCTDSFLSDYSGNNFPIKEAHVDHYPDTFDSIVKKFFQKEGIDIKNTMLTRSVDASSVPVWQDPELIKRFLVFHARFGLRLVAAKENNSEIKKENNAANASRSV